MKTTNPIKTLDQQIKKHVQAMEQDVPPELETAFIEKLNGIVPGESPFHRHRFIYYGALVTAATVLLAVCLAGPFIPISFISSKDQWRRSRGSLGPGRPRGGPTGQHLYH